MLPPIDILTPEVLDELGESLISRILGPVESNTNGSYVRLENGLQVCWASNAIPYGATAGTWTFPAPFIGSVVAVPIPRRGSSPGTFSLRVGATLTNTQVSFERSGGDISVDAIAIGRWK